MGWLSNVTQRIKGLFNKNKRLSPGIENNRYSKEMDLLGIPIMDENTGETIYFRECFDTQAHVPYNDGQTTTILQAKIYRYDKKSNKPMLFEGGTSICIEVPVGTTLEELKDSGWLNYILNQPAASKQFLDEEKVNHIGRIDLQNSKLFPATPGMDSWVDQNLTTKLQQQKQAELEKSKTKSAKEEQRRVSQMQEKMNERYTGGDHREEQKRRNMQNPKFVGLPEYGSYDLNSLKNGNIISISIIGNPQKIKHRDGSIDYVYSAYREDREDIEDEINLSSLGANIQFSLPMPIEEMLRLANDKSNPDNARAVALMMEQLVDMPKVGNSLFVGAIKKQNGSLVFGDRQYSERTLRILGQSADKINNNSQIDRQSQYDR